MHLENRPFSCLFSRRTINLVEILCKVFSFSKIEALGRKLSLPGAPPIVSGAGGVKFSAPTAQSRMHEEVR